MGRRARPTSQRLDELSAWDDDHRHLLWNGKLHRGNPAIKVDGIPVHPLRIRLGIQELSLRDRKLIAIRKLPDLCDHPRCINPDHHEVQVKTDHYRDNYTPDWRPPSAFSIHDENDIASGLELLAEGHGYDHEEFEFIPQHLIDEIKRRAGHI